MWTSLSPAEERLKDARQPALSHSLKKVGKTTGSIAAMKVGKGETWARSPLRIQPGRRSADGMFDRQTGLRPEPHGRLSESDGRLDNASDPTR